MAEKVLVKASRPSFGSNIRSTSYLQEHQQYRALQHDVHAHQGIDSIVEGLQNTAIAAPQVKHNFSADPSKSPPSVIDSGLNYSLSHNNCQPADGTASDRLIATLFYKTRSPRATITDYPPDRLPDLKSSLRIIPANLAPVRNFSNFPLEPPPPDPEPLDHLYGSYISPLCLTSFLHLVSSLPFRPGSTTLSSSHRCLDNIEHPTIVELTFSPSPNPTYLTLSDLRKHELIYRFEREWNVDVVLQADTVFRRYPRLVVFDMDSTLIEQEVIDLIAASIGVEDQVSNITARAMNGELDFSTSLRERAKLLKGVDADIFKKLRSVITPTKGVKQLLPALKRLGIKTAVLSGGFIPLTQWLADELGIDYAFANTLASDPTNGKLTGEIVGTIVNAERKRDLLLEIAEKENVALEQVVAVGDGANDLLMMEKASLGVAFNAKPVVQIEAKARLNGESLLDMLYIFGFTAEEVKVLTR